MRRVDRVTLDLRASGWPLLQARPSRPAPELWVADPAGRHLATVTVDHAPGTYRITSGETVDLAPSAEQATAFILCPGADPDDLTVRPATITPLTDPSTRVFTQGPRFRHTSELTRADYANRLIRGGYPEAVARDDPKRRQRFFDSYIGDLINRDVMQPSEIERTAELRTQAFSFGDGCSPFRSALCGRRLAMSYNARSVGI